MSCQVSIHPREWAFIKTAPALSTPLEFASSLITWLRIMEAAFNFVLCPKFCHGVSSPTVEDIEYSCIREVKAVALLLMPVSHENLRWVSRQYTMENSLSTSMFFRKFKPRCSFGNEYFGKLHSLAISILYISIWFIGMCSRNDVDRSKKAPAVACFMNNIIGCPLPLFYTRFSRVQSYQKTEKENTFGNTAVSYYVIHTGCISYMTRIWLIQ